MKVLLQRVAHAEVRVAGAAVGRIGTGLLVFLGIERGDSEATCDYFAAKAADVRIFPDEENRMNRSVEEFGGEVLVVSQFTLAASTRRGRRPSFTGAAAPERAEVLYRRFVDVLLARGLRVVTGTFRAMMEVELVNDGPVTLLLDPPSSEAES